MAFTNAELNNILNAALPFYVKGKAFEQTIQEKPLLDALISKQETFSGGSGKISIPVQFDYDQSSFAGYTHNDTVGYTNPANLKRAEFTWKEVHAGLTVTHTELKIDGISVEDSAIGKNTSEHSGRDVHVLTGLLQNKLADMGEAWSRSMNSMLWRDGTHDAKQVPGLMALIADYPLTGTLGGIDRALQSAWRNRALVNQTAFGGSDLRITPSTSLQTLTKTLRTEVRQLRRYGGTPNLVLCGSRFLEALEAEIHEKGIYTQEGFMKKTNDIGMSEISMTGVGTFRYDPTLDDLSRSRFAYFIDTKNVKLKVMQGEDRKIHNPARPHDQYALYRAMTWTGAMIAKQLNGSGVYEVNF
jgi:hypothetical protein